MRRTTRRAFVAGALGMAGVALASACAPGPAPSSTGTTPPVAPLSPSPVPSAAPAASQVGSPPPAPSLVPAAQVSPVVSGSTLQLSYPGAGAPNAWCWAAADGGYFQQYGLDVSMTNVAGSAQALAAVLSGETPLCCGITCTQIIGSDLKGADAVIVAVFVNTFPSSILSQLGITSAGQLVGKTFGVIGINDAGGVAARFYLRHENVDPNGVTFISTGGQPQTFAGLQAGSLTAGILSAPAAQMAERAGFPELADLATLGIPYAYNTLTTTKSYLASHQDQVRAVLQASIAGAHRMKADQAFGESVLQHWTNTTDPQTLSDVWTALNGYLSDRPTITQPGVQAGITDLAGSDPSVGDPDPTQFYDSTLLDQLDQSGFFQQLGIS